MLTRTVELYVHYEVVMDYSAEEVIKMLQSLANQDLLRSRQSAGKCFGF